MKLHLPLPLRSALAAAFACLSAAAESEIVWTVDAPEGYRADFVSCTRESYQCEYDSLMNTGTTSVTDSATEKKQYITNNAIYSCFYQQVERATHTHVLSTGTGFGHSTTYQNVVLIDEDGKGTDITWNCSAEDRPGVWILASSDSTGTATFTNYGDMVVDGSRQQWIKKQAAALSNGVVTDWTFTTCNFSDHALFSGLFQIGFNLKVTDTDSFTYKNAYTSDKGAFVYGCKSLVFDNVNDITFSGNRADVSGAIAFAGDGGWSNTAGEITDDAGFVVRNVTGTVTFDGNSSYINPESGGLSGTNEAYGGLFRGYLVRFKNVNEVIFSNNPCRIFTTYSSSIYTGFENCNRIEFSKNGTEGLSDLISRGSGTGIFGTGSMRFEHCGDIIISDNTLSSRLFRNFPVFENINSLTFTGNKSTGTLISYDDKSHTVTGVKDSFIIDNNTISASGGVYGAALVDMSYSDRVLTVEGVRTTDSSGTEEKTRLFSVSANTVSGLTDGFFSYCLLKINNFEKAQFDRNSYTDENNSYRSYAAFSKLELNQVDDISICDNKVSSTDKTVSGLLGTLDASDFVTLQIKGNKLEAYGLKSGISSGTLTLIGDTSGNRLGTVEITDNERTCSILSGSYGGVNIANLQSFSFSNNKDKLTNENSNSNSVLSYGFLGSSGIFSNVGSITFSGNEISNQVAGRTNDHISGGLLAFSTSATETLKIDGSDSVTISGNKVMADKTSGIIRGGLIYLESRPDAIKNVKTLTISGNTAGGVVSADNPNGFTSKVYGTVAYGSLPLENCETVMITDNAAYGATDARGGAFYHYSLSMSGVDYLTIARNKAVSSENGVAYGGAIYGSDVWTIDKQVTMESNTVIGGSAYGGAIVSVGNVSLCLQGDGEHTQMDIRNNYAEALAEAGEACGGALMLKAYSQTIKDFSKVSVTGNYAKAQNIDNARGGGIYTGTDLILENNDKVLIRGNYVTDGSTYRLSGIESSREIALNAGENQSIEIYDSVNTSGHLYFNKTAAQTGTILLSGKNTVVDLKAIGSQATAEEVESSRLVSANSMYQYGGTLQVKDGMKLKADAFYHRGGKVEFENAAMDAGYIDMGIVEVKGANTWKFSQNYDTDELTFNLSAQNTKTPVLTLENSSTSIYGIKGMYQGKYIISSDETLRTGIYRLLSFDSTKIQWTNLSYIGLEGLCSATTIGTAGASDVYFLTEGDMTTLVFDYVKPRYLTWVSTSGTWSEGTGMSSGTWSSDEPDTNFYEGDHVIFNKAATVTIRGKVKPASIKVSNTSGNVVLNAASGGSITGSTKLTKSGAGTLTIKNTNDFTGGTYISGGKVVLEANNALGSGPIQISGGASLSSSGSVYAQSLTLSGNALFYAKGSVAKAVTLTGNLESTGSKVTMFGNLKLDNLTLKNSTMSNNGSSAVNITMKNRAYLSASSLTLGGALSGTNLIMSGSQLTQSGSATGLNMSGKIAVGSKSTLTTAGTITGTNLAVTGNSTLNAKNATARSITLTGNLEGTKATMNMYGNVKANNLALKLATLTNSGTNDCTFTIGNRAYLTDTTMVQKGDMTAKNMTLSNSKLTHTGSKLALGEKLALGSKSTLNSNAALSAINVILTGGSTLNVQNAAAKDVSVTSNLQVTDSTLKMHGNLNAGNLVVQNGSFLGNGKTAKSYVVRNKATLSNAKLDINGYLSAKAATLSGSHLKQYGHANGVKVTGQLTMFNNSTITTSGTLSAGSMTLTGGTINLTSDTLKAITVTNTLTLNKAIDLNLGCTNLVKGKDYKLISFNKTNLTKSSNLANLLGMSGSGASLTLSSNAITLKVTDSSAWNKYVTANKNLFNSTTTAMLPETEAEAEEGEMTEEIATTSLSETTEAVAAFDRSGADALVQSNWGMLNASRAFTDTIGNRAANRRALGEEQKSAVWMSAMGASSRLSSDGEAAGSDYNLYGAAFGMEQQLTEKSSLGLAIGESRGKVSSFTATRTKQDTLHTALYGQHLLQQSTSNALTLDWSAAYGRTESKWQGVEWEQKSVQLDARSTWAHQLNAKTTVSGFAGMQYYASESATVAPGIKSGSIQNLRGEIGAGIGHRATSKTSIYGELSFVGDMVRHNPTASIGEQRERGSNPGRVGLNLSTGVHHALNERWSVNASYNLELQERANSHSANIGAGYKF